PVGAKVTTSIGLVGSTPATFKVSRKGGFTGPIEKEGYEPVTVQVTSQVAGAGAAGMAGNVILGGLVGAAIDAGSGATKHLKPNPINVKLVPLDPLKKEAEETEMSGESPSDSGETESDSSGETREMEQKEKSLSFRIDLCPVTKDHILVSVTQLG
ncbi:MAG: hypothetical protein U9Q79_02930, partial [Candidatus Hydrogenedentes bacterium]|nr:hypothetical protein [Candidatus Hydrogenedentota bacterium]